MPLWWVATSGARSIDVDLDLEVTTVIKAPNWTDSFCDGFYKDASGTTATARLVAVQLDGANRPCAPAYETSAKQLFISSDTHHNKLHLSLRDIPVSASTQCTRKFSLYGVASGSGSTLYLQLPNYSTGIARNRM
jgi:hypothetical protein